MQNLLAIFVLRAERLHSPRRVIISSVKRRSQRRPHNIAKSRVGLRLVKFLVTGVLYQIMTLSMNETELIFEMRKEIILVKDEYMPLVVPFADTKAVTSQLRFVARQAFFQTVRKIVGIIRLTHAR